MATSQCVSQHIAYVTKGDGEFTQNVEVSFNSSNICPEEKDSDFSDFESDEFDESEQDINCVELRVPAKNALSISDHRRERVRELVVTEIEYVRDLEILLKVTSDEDAKEQYNSSLDMNVLLGNIIQVIEIARRFLQDLNDVSHCDDNEMVIGQVFLQYVEELSQIYKVYCSSYNVDVLPLLKKYESEENASTVMKHLAEELRSYKRHLLDLNCVLIKPVQRILKYPLYLDELVSSTPESHPDFNNLEQARTSFQAAAKDINEYTRAVDLVHKYRGDCDASLNRKMRRVSLRSLAKKSFRVTTRLSQKLGVSGQTLNSELNKLEVEFQSVRKAAKTLVKSVTTLTEALRKRHSTELWISEMLTEIFSEAPEAYKVTAIAENAFRNIFQMFDNEIQHRVLHPARQILMLCEGPENLIQKTHKIMLDYDMVQVKLQAALEPSRIASVIEESAGIRATYEALSNQLVTELPVFIEHSIGILTICVQSVVSAHMYLQGHLAKLYIGLTQEPGLTYITPSDAREKAAHQVDLIFRLLPLDYQRKQSSKKKDTPIKKTEKAEHIEIRSKSQERSVETSKPRSTAEFFKNIPSISKGRSRRSYPINTNLTTEQTPKEPRRISAPYEYFKSWSPSVRRHYRKGLFTISDNLQDKTEKKKALDEQYPSEVLYKVVEEHLAKEDNELHLQTGTLVAVLRKKNPMGGEDRWVADDGKKIGLVRPSFLQPAENGGNTEDPSHPRLSSHSSSKAALKSFSQVSDGNPYNDVTKFQHSENTHQEVLDSISEPTVVSSTHGERNSPHDLSSYNVLTSRRQSHPENSYSDSSDEWNDADNRDPANANNELDGIDSQTGQDEQQRFVALYNFTAGGSDQLSLEKEQLVFGINTEHDDWWYVKDLHGNQGYVPATYLVEHL